MYSDSLPERNQVVTNKTEVAEIDKILRQQQPLSSAFDGSSQTAILNQDIRSVKESLEQNRHHAASQENGGDPNTYADQNGHDEVVDGDGGDASEPLSHKEMLAL